VTNVRDRRMGRVMAVDLGDRRIGVAISDPTGTIASPAGFVERRAGKRPPLTALLARAVELEAAGFVIGLPLDANGAETPRTAEARRLAHELSFPRASWTNVSRPRRPCRRYS
jgi:putative Holliday junction resolvase